MALSSCEDAAVRLVNIAGQSSTLVERLRQPLLRALGGRGSYYLVRVESVGRVGEVLVRISGSRTHVPLLFGLEDLEPGYVCRVVREAVDRFDV